MDAYRTFMINLARRAGSIMLQNFSLGMRKEWKRDGTPLTVTDAAINALVIESIKSEFPDHSLLGEEASNIHDSEYVWVCDPVDGTTAFSHGLPTFMFSLALTHLGESITGVLFDPVLDRMFYAAKGEGSFLNLSPIRVAADRSLAQKSKKVIVNLDTDIKLRNLRILMLNKGALATAFYSATYGSALVACGEFVGQVYEYDKPWDGAAVKIIVEEAGGRVTDLSGADQRYDEKLNGFVATNGLIHDELLDDIRSLSP